LKDKNENITLWILERDRKENRAKIEKEKNRQQEAERHRCPKCKSGLSEPKLIQYYVCPICESKFEREHESEARLSGCEHWYGFLCKRSESIGPTRMC
jgi:hypothetical protein